MKGILEDRQVSNTGQASIQHKTGQNLIQDRPVSNIGQARIQIQDRPVSNSEHLGSVK